ncbi:hypothetical protein [Paenibacillus arenilitoris]|uniref:Secreted protein n=1 Tax=Paenibacillus arenilitoris TaxID=2772299 RepID=A0A927CIA8_9BACL|nr:hypothetical protein [Paenibacillus arenilitoris]MBD2868618.1 hypothetical protein [Paenibacillus arenilitoris]
MKNNKWLPLVSLLLIVGLLAACGRASERNNEPAAGHEGHGGQAANNGDGAGSAGGGGHGDHGGGTQETGGKASGGVNATFGFVSGAAKANEESELTIRITGEDGEPINDFEVSHEKLLHLIVVNHDLSFFNHIHPDYVGEGKFTVKTSFPAGGAYKVFADFIPSGGSSETISEWIDVEGEEGKHAAIAPDAKLVKEAGGKEIELAMSGAKPGEETKLTFTIRDAATKEGIDDLEPYLGAVGHVVILSDDAESYLHVHPLDEAATGPTAEFATAFPRGGVYKIWGQFQHEGEVITVPFVVEVKS